MSKALTAAIKSAKDLPPPVEVEVEVEVDDTWNFGDPDDIDTADDSDDLDDARADDLEDSGVAASSGAG